MNKHIKIGVEKAQAKGRKSGFRKGQTVAHPTDKMTYGYQGQENGNAVLHLNGVTKRFPPERGF